MAGAVARAAALALALVGGCAEEAPVPDDLAPPERQDPRPMTLADLAERTHGAPGEETPLAFDHLRPTAPVRRASFLRGRGGVFLVSGDRAARPDPLAAAPLFAPLETPEAARELVLRFEPGSLVPEPAAAPLFRALAARGFATPAAPPPGGIDAERAGDVLRVRGLFLRKLAGGAEVASARFAFARDGRGARRDEALIRVAPPAELAPLYESAAPAPMPNPARDRARDAHEARLRAFWDAVREAAPALAN
jgi:hypothetical protein